ncbi:MAG: hypothetical protein M3R25_04340 [Bacteroidota bacterium]|nr:hypothetical protein [Bacteroidota bacterium]
MKTLTILLIGILAVSRLSGQDLSELATRNLVNQQIELYNRFGLDVKDYSFKNAEVNIGLKNINRYFQHANAKIGIGIVLAVIGGAIITIASISEERDSPLQPTSVGGINFSFDLSLNPGILGGSLVLGGSVPFIVSGLNHRHKMKEEIVKMKMLLMQ